MTDKNIVSRRSFIFCPGLRPDMFPKAVNSGTDIVCIELEDGIAPKDKDEARKLTLSLFNAVLDGKGAELIVRVNSVRDEFGLADIRAILETSSPPPAIMLPKVKTPDEVKWVDELLSEREHKTRLHVIIETNAGLEAVYDIAKSSNRIDALFFGGVDMAAELRCKNAWEPLLYARSRVAHAAAGADLDVIDVPYLDLEDLSGMIREAELVRDLGFSGKGCIHPKQISSINEVFTPDGETVANAKKIIKAFKDAETGLVVIDGKLIEKPVLRHMERVVAIANRVSEK